MTWTFILQKAKCTYICMSTKILPNTVLVSGCLLAEEVQRFVSDWNASSAPGPPRSVYPHWQQSTSVGEMSPDQGSGEAMPSGFFMKGIRIMLVSLHIYVVILFSNVCLTLMTTFCIWFMQYVYPFSHLSVNVRE